MQKHKNVEFLFKTGIIHLGTYSHNYMVIMTYIKFKYSAADKANLLKDRDAKPRI